MPGGPAESWLVDRRAAVARMDGGALKIERIDPGDRALAELNANESGDQDGEAEAAPAIRVTPEHAAKTKRGAAAFLCAGRPHGNSRAAASTSSAWPGTFTLRQMRKIVPSRSIRKVARSIPIYLRP